MKWNVYNKMDFVKVVFGKYEAEFTRSGDQIRIKLVCASRQSYWSGKISNQPLVDIGMSQSTADLFTYIKDTKTSSFEVSNSVLSVKFRKGKFWPIQLVPIPIRYYYSGRKQGKQVESSICALKQEIEALGQKENLLVCSHFKDYLIEMLREDLEHYELQKELQANKTNMDSQESSQQDDYFFQKFASTRIVSNITIIIPPSFPSRPLRSFLFKANNPPKITSQKIDFDFNVDPWNPHLHHFAINGNTIQKVSDGQPVMVYGSNYIPAVGNFSIKLRIQQITEGQVEIGLINSRNKHSQFVGQDNLVVMLSLDSSKIMIDGKEFGVSFLPFEQCDTIEMCVDMACQTIKFYRNGRDKSFLEVTVPERMQNLKLFPFVQMRRGGDKVEFLA